MAERVRNGTPTTGPYATGADSVAAYGRPPVTMAVGGDVCDVCGRPLSSRGSGKTGLCIECIRAGAAFARAWMVDLNRMGLRHREVAAIIGTTRDSVRNRVSELRRGVTP